MTLRGADVSRKRCRCGCTILLDTFNRSGDELAADGVNVAGASRYSFASSSWAVVSNALKCQTTGAALTFHTGNAYVNVGSVRFASVGDYFELSTGHTTLTLTVENYTYSGATKKRLKVEFAGTTSYRYGSSIAFGLTLPYTLLSVDLRMLDCSEDWNKICEYVDHDSPDLVTSTVATRIGQGTFFDGSLSYAWTMKATSGVIVDGLTITRNDIDCGTVLPTCSQTCGGLWPDTITLVLGTFADGETACRDAGYSACLSDCLDAYETALADYEATAAAYRLAHGHVDPTDYCEQKQSLKEAYKTCRCTCVDDHWSCQTGSPCSALNGSIVLDRRDTPENQLGPGCGIYEAYVEVPGFYTGNVCGDTSAYETGWYLFFECAVSVVYYDEDIPERTKYRFNLSLPFVTSGGSGRMQTQLSGEVGQSAWCEGGSLVTGESFGSNFKSVLVLDVFRMATLGAALNYYGSIVHSDSLGELPTCGPHIGGPLCGGQDEETCARQIGLDGGGSPEYEDPGTVIGTTEERLIADCPGSEAVVPTFGLTSSGAGT